MVKNRITLSGFAGTGKSTIGKILAEKLNCKFVSVGDFSRDYAKNKSPDINEFQEECKCNPEHDKMIDGKFSEECNQDINIIVDYRLGFHFIKDAFHVLLKVSDEIAAARIQKSNREKEDTDIDSIKKRNQAMRQRFIDTYNVDFADENNYDLIIGHC
ncbi:cytidylate kinase [Bacteroidales bacterium Barb4]|nr:cytidylate kinase [Bacteroidales bacterium Barb4]